MHGRRNRTTYRIAAVVGLAAILTACSGGGGGNSASGNGDGDNGGRNVISVPSGGIPDPGPADVEIHNFRFEDETHTISVGDTVMWVNEGSAPHTVNFTADDGSGTIRTAHGYEREFDEAGTYEYFCNNHPGMEGTIIVE